MYAQQTETIAKRRVERAEAFIAPVEAAVPTVEEKRNRKRRKLEGKVDGDDLTSEGGERKRKKKRVKERDDP